MNTLEKQGTVGSSRSYSSSDYIQNTLNFQSTRFELETSFVSEAKNRSEEWDISLRFYLCWSCWMCSTDPAADSAQLLGSQTPLTMVTSVISFDFGLSFKVSTDWIMFNCCLNRKGQKDINKPAAFILTQVITLRLMEQKRVRPPGVALITDYQIRDYRSVLQHLSEWRLYPFTVKTRARY